MEQPKQKRSKLTTFLRNEDSPYKKIFYTYPEALFLIDIYGYIVEINQGVSTLTEFEPIEVIGKNFKEIVVEEDLASVIEYFQLVLNGEIQHCTFRIQQKSLKIKYVEVTFTPIHVEGDIIGIYGLAKDFTATIELEQKMKQSEETFQNLIQYLAYHDHLTGMCNRKYFEKRIRQEVESAKKNGEEFAVFIIDLDGFKFINDTLGHDIGDHLLCEVAQRLFTELEHVEVLARLGGDEFGLLQLGIHGEDEVKDLAFQLKNAFDEPFCKGDFELYITCSIGVSTYPNGGVNMHKLMKNADAAMYQSKEQGKNQYEIYTPSMNNNKYRIFTLKNHLRKALEFDEFMLHFQPRINSQTDEIVGVEALLRWYHPSFGTIPPNEFIPIAEEDGQIIAIGEWVLDRACAQNKHWQKLGLPPIKMSVNFSVLQFLKKDLVDMVRSTLERHELDPVWLEIEITESAVLENNPCIIETLKKLQSMGITIALDDFGTGYSSLSYLRKYKIDTLKIDRSFVTGIPFETESFEITKTIITLAQNLKMNVVAEGVETEEQLNALKEINCKEIQGYYYSKPLPKQQFKELLVNKKMVIK
ncbi:bifunctional diguanylate cyclase/phosphodiesterase [Alkalihalobacillus sp. BA299]|uniref:bifunctional diguanylate cyclase/phosphodiesterase n=1 Tax=Alkalihalobacillus sp. BA299 TaxID=2815938 RepID=UPI001ADA4C47|nr:bifunctional diguanylate cyclase/phosphodiesterase [Alkalihalobacillus sp. BA299]